MKCALSILLLGLAATSSAAPPTPRFEKIVLTDQYLCDGVNAGDFNRDGFMDAVAGPYWYEGPAFARRHAFYTPRIFPTEVSPTDSMFSYVHDFNGDGWPDILVFGRVHLHQAFWYENPRKNSTPWPKHFVFHRIQGESPPFQDADGDGRPEIVAHWKGRWGMIQPVPNRPTDPWTFQPVTDPGEYHHFYHGTGLGDVNGDGRLDLILNEGWFEQPAALESVWKFHPQLFGTKGGAQMFAFDVDQDGDNDVVTALDAHGWGLAWFEQVQKDATSGFVQRTIMGDRSEETRYGAAFSQPHALAVADINGDGAPDIVAGKRRWAHGPKGDVEPMADPVVYWFELISAAGEPPRFVPHLIDAASGVGVQIAVTDMNGDGRPDVLTSSKLGAFLFLNRD